MKILWIPQISSIDKVSKKFLLDCDSNIVTFLNYQSAIVDTGIDLTVVLPTTSQVDMWHYKRALYKDAHICQIPFEMNVFLSRFNLNTKDLTLQLGTEGPYDWIFMHDPALVMNMRTLLSVINQKATRIACWNHWIDSPLMPKTDGYFNYALRQLEGMLHSDLPITVSTTAQKEINFAAQHYLSSSLAEKLESKLKVINNPVDEDLYSKYYKSRITYERPTLLFNHRASSFPLYKMNLERFVKFATFAKQEHNVDVIFSNPTGYELAPELKEFAVSVGPYSREQYLYLLAKRPIITAFFDHPPLWPYAHLESAALGCPQILPNEEPYCSMFGADYNMLYQYDTKTNIHLSALKNLKLLTVMHEDAICENIHNRVLERHNSTIRVKQLLEEVERAESGN